MDSIPMSYSQDIGGTSHAVDVAWNHKASKGFRKALLQGLLKPVTRHHIYSLPWGRRREKVWRSEHLYADYNWLV